MAHAELLRPLIERVQKGRREESATIGSGPDAESFQAVPLAGLDDLEFVPSFHPDLVLGVATYALELLRKAPDLDIL